MKNANPQEKTNQGHKVLGNCGPKLSCAPPFKEKY
jgi:hypothetical protein